MVTDFLSIEPSTIVFTLLNLLILVLFLRHFLFDKVNSVLEERQSEVDKAFNDAEEASAKARQLETLFLFFLEQNNW